MSSISVLLKTKNCRNVHFNWMNVESTDLAFIKRHECFADLYDIPDTFKTLYDFALFLNNKKTASKKMTVLKLELKKNKK